MGESIGGKVAYKKTYIYIYIPKLFLITRTEKAYTKFFKSLENGLGWFFKTLRNRFFLSAEVSRTIQLAKGGKMDHLKNPKRRPCKRENRTKAFSDLCERW